MPWQSTGFTLGKTGFPQAGNLVFYIPSGDTTGAADTIQVNNMLSSGLSVVLTPGQYYTNAPWQLISGSMILGCGAASVVNAVSPFTGSYMIVLTTPASVVRTALINFVLFPAVTGVGGIQLDNTGYTPPGLPGLNDTLHYLQDMLVIEAGGDSFHFDNQLREMRAIGCKSYNAAGDGWFFGNSGGAGSGATDNFIIGCTAGHSAGHGFHILGSNNLFTGCKGWGSGFSAGSISGTTQAGFRVGEPGGGPAKNTLTGCQAQQNALHGFDVESANYTAITGCDADANGAGTGVTTGAGINVHASQFCSIVGNVGQPVLTGQPGNQVYGIAVDGNLTSTEFTANAVNGLTADFQDNGSSGTIYTTLPKNLLLGSAVASLGGAGSALQIFHSTDPSSNPASGSGLLYVDATGHLTYRGAAGTVTQIATA